MRSVRAMPATPFAADFRRKSGLKVGRGPPAPAALGPRHINAKLHIINMIGDGILGNGPGQL